MGHKKDKQKKQPSLLRELVVVVGTALILSILVRTFLIQAFYVPSASMEDTLQENDRIIVSKISTELTGIDRFNVVVFHDPGGWLGEGFPNPYDTRANRRLVFWIQFGRLNFNYLGLARKIRRAAHTVFWAATQSGKQIAKD
jgi:signal peptidase I